MTAKVGSLHVDLTLETARFQKGLTEAQAKLSKTTKGLQDLGSKLSSVGKTMSIGITAPLTAFGVTAFNAASDAAELQSAFNQTFGSMSGEMNRWAEETGDAMGRATHTMQEAANSFGLFFNNAFPPEKAAEMSKSFAKLTQDFESFHNTDPGEALQVLAAGLRGESEPLSRFGVMLNEAEVKAKAFQMGLAGLGDELTAQEKIQARAALIMEKTANAQGDVARTSDGTANQIRKSKEAFEDLQVTVGTKLLPLLTPLIEKIGKAIEWFSKLPAPVQDTALVVAALSAAFGPTLVAVGSLLPLLTKLAPAVSLVGKAMMFLGANPVILGLALVIGGIYLAWKNWDKIEPILRRLYNGVKTWIVDKLGAVWNVVTGAIDKVKRAFFNLYDAVVGNSYIPDMVDGISAEMKRLDAVMVAPVAAATGAAEQAFRDMAGNVQGLLDRLFPEIRELLDHRDDLATIAGSGLSPDMQAEARRRAGFALAGVSGKPGGPDLGEAGPIASVDMDAVQRGLAAITEATSKVREGWISLKEAGSYAFGEISHQLKGVLLGAQSLGDAIRNVVSRLAEMSLDWAFSALGTAIGLPIPGFAKGTNFAPGGLALVGERGPELVNLPRGSQVIPNNELRGMGGQQVHQPTFVFPGVSDARSAREAAGQAATRYRQLLNGPVRA